MRAIYIGSGQKAKKNSGPNFNFYMYLFLFFAILGSALKVTGPFIVEEWINRNGVGKTGYAFTIRDVDINLSQGQLVLNDVKISNPKTSKDMLESPKMVLQLNWSDLMLHQEKHLSVTADKVDFILSKDFSSEMKRFNELDSIEAKFGKFTVVEQKEDQSRTVLELNDVNLKMKDISEFSVSSKIDEGGKLELTGKSGTIRGSLKEVRSNIFNKIAGDKLPFVFNEARLNADIEAVTENGKVVGEISPKIRKLNLVEEKPGIPTQTIARILSDELTFTLPFTVKDEVTLEYTDTFRKLKSYRKYAAVTPEATPVQEAQKEKKSVSFWPF